MIIDTHVHLDHEKYREDFSEILERAFQNGVRQFIIPGADPDDLGRAVSLAESHESIFFAVGVHPYERTKFSQEILERYVSHPRCIAIGECGLDYYRLPEEKEAVAVEKQEQQRVFREQIRFAKAHQLPLIVHIRDASQDSLEILLEEEAGEVGGVLHCYNADEQLLALTQQGFYYGIGGVLTFKNAKKLPQVLEKIPLDRLIVETDGPYLTPHPHRGKRNEPSYLPFILEKMAQIRALSPEEIEEAAFRNSQALFKALPQVS